VAKTFSDDAADLVPRVKALDEAYAEPVALWGEGLADRATPLFKVNVWRDQARERGRFPGQAPPRCGASRLRTRMWETEDGERDCLA
jgi:hypothetical protein